MSESAIMTHFEKWGETECDELSVWLFSGKRNLNFVASNPKSAPKLNSNNTYVICQASHNVKILGDAGYDSIKIFFWIGQRCEDHENAFEQTMFDLKDWNTNDRTKKIKVRIYVEFQYNESLPFFSIWNRFSQVGQKQFDDENTHSFCVLQYLDIIIPEGLKNNRPRSVPFPKYLIIKQNQLGTTSRDTYIRIHEKKKLDTKSEKVVIIYLEGRHLDRVKQTPTENMAPDFQISEEITSIKVHTGADADLRLKQFVGIFYQTLMFKYANASLSKGQISDLHHVAGSYILPAVRPEYWYAPKYLKNYQITSLWGAKKNTDEEEIKDINNDMVIWKNVGKEPEKECYFVKPEKEHYSSETSVSLTRIVFTKKTVEQATNHAGRRAISHKTGSIKSQYQIQFQTLKLDTFDSSCLSKYQVYIISTPLHLLLWLGSEVPSEYVIGSLNILKAFAGKKRRFNFQSRPHYVAEMKNSDQFSCHIEFQGYESQMFRYHLGKSRYTPGSEDRIGYFMLRKPRMAFWANDEVAELVDSDEENGQEKGFDNLFDRFQGNGAENAIQRKKSEQMIRLSTVNLNRTSSFKVNSMIQSQFRNSFDIEQELLMKSNYLTEMESAKFFNQRKLIKAIKASFYPTSCLSLPQITGDRRTNFDNLWLFEIQGPKFIQIKKDFMTSVFDAERCYYVVLIKDTCVAIYLWRGLEDTGGFLDTNKALSFFTDTCFQTVLDQKEGPKRKGSVMHQLQGLDLTGGVFEKSKTKQLDDLSLAIKSTNSNDLLSFGGAAQVKPATDAKLKKRSSDAAYVSDKKKSNSVFKPMDQQMNFKNENKLVMDRAENLESVKKGETKPYEIALRSLVTMDQEPMHFLQAFQGSLVITTGKYKNRKKQVFSDDFENQESNLMMFQLIGLPNLSQKAREVPPFKTSMTSSGLFVLIGKMRIIFWIGHEYFQCYLTDENFQDTKTLVSDDMINKLIYIYDSAYLSYEEAAEMDQQHIQLSQERKTVFCVEGHEDDEVNEYFAGERINFGMIKVQDSSSEEEESTFFIPFENSLSIKYWLPQEPRLFALCVGKGEVENFETEINTQDGDDLSMSYSQRWQADAMVDKEILNFSQDQLDPRGIYLLDFDSEAFIWVGQDVKQKEKIANAFPMALNAMKNIHSRGNDRLKQVTVSMVRQAFEPIVFRQAFRKGWKMYDKPSDQIHEFDGQSDEESDSSNSIVSEHSSQDAEEEVKQVEFMKLNKESLVQATQSLIAEGFWIN